MKKVHHLLENYHKLVFYYYIKIVYVSVSYESWRTPLKKSFNLYPYKMAHELLPLDFGIYVYCHWFNTYINNDNIWNLDLLLDETWFTLSEYVNSQNYQSWTAENQHSSIVFSVQVGVWVAISRSHIYGCMHY